MTRVRRALKARVRRLAAGPERTAPVERTPVERTQGPPPPPPPRQGYVAAPPDFVGVGTMKSGTSWWSELIAAHPGAIAPLQNAQTGKRAKELHFFDQFCERSFTDEDAAAYWSYFARPAGMLSGEWTPRYAVDFWTPPLLRRAAPDAKLLFLVRDPIDRYRSGVTHEMQRGRTEQPANRSRDHFQRGLYHSQLTWIFEHFPPAQVLVLQFEQCIREPAAELRRTYEFLGLDPEFVPDLGTLSTHSTKAARAELPADLVASLRQLYRNDAAALFAAVPELDPALWARTMGDDPPNGS